jgi:hypothetical protein
VGAVPVGKWGIRSRGKWWSSMSLGTWFPRSQRIRHRLPALRRNRWKNHDRWACRMRDRIGTYHHTMIIPPRSRQPHPIPQKRSSRSRDLVRILSLDSEIMSHFCRYMGRSHRRYRTDTHQSRHRITCRRRSRICGIREWGILRSLWVRLRLRGIRHMMGSDIPISRSMRIRDMCHTTKRIGQHRLTTRIHIHHITKDQKSGVRAWWGNSGWRIL